jgi:hypothetical protein
MPPEMTTKSKGRGPGNRRGKRQTPESAPPVWVSAPSPRSEAVEVNRPGIG